MPKERSASFTIASRHLVLAEVHGKVAADNQVHQSQLATAEGQNLHLAASLAKVISGQIFYCFGFNQAVKCLTKAIYAGKSVW